MPRPASQHPTELELEILKVLWETGPSTARQVRDRLAPRRKLAHTSVLTMLNIMVNKGYLEREKQTGGYVYGARVTATSTARGMLRDLVDRVFGGSTVAAMLNLLHTKDINEEELKELRELIRTKGKEKEE